MNQDPLELPVNELFKWAYYNRESVHTILNSDIDILLAARKFITDYKVKRRILNTMDKFISPIIDSVMLTKFMATEYGVDEIDNIISSHQSLKESVEKDKGIFVSLMDYIRKREILNAYRELDFPENFTMDQLCAYDSIYDYAKLDAAEEEEIDSTPGEVHSWSYQDLSENMFPSETTLQLSDEDIPAEAKDNDQLEEEVDELNQTIIDLESKVEDMQDYINLLEYKLGLIAEKADECQGQD